MLAEGLAGRRIASLRYDKRGIGESRAAMPREEDLRFETYIEDAAGWAEQLRRDRRFSTLTIAGHSEGSLIGMVAAREAKANAFASLAGAGRPAPEILHEQLSKQLPPPMLAEADTILAALSAGRRVDTVPPMLMALFRPSVQPYLISWFRYDPRKEIARLTIPVLIVQGTTDLQVDVADARALAAADPRAKLVVVEGMNHIFKDVPADPQQQLASYGNPDLPVDPRLITAVAELIRGVR
jgi:pimeloyl-ACP methyl ester carboxylesterase